MAYFRILNFRVQGPMVTELDTEFQQVDVLFGRSILISTFNKR